MLLPISLFLCQVEGNQTLSREIMAAVAIFSCRPNSNSFQERHMSLHEPVKIGRAVARTRSSPNNGIFDCKVLSRNHALLWYESGKVSKAYLLLLYTCTCTLCVDWKPFLLAHYAANERHFNIIFRYLKVRNKIPLMWNISSWEKIKSLI